MLPSGVRRTYNEMDNKTLLAELQRQSRMQGDAFLYIQGLMIGRVAIGLEELINAGGERSEVGEVLAGKPVRGSKAKKGT